MATNGITVKPMRMGDLVSTSSVKLVGKYMPPSKRSDPQIEKIDMSDKNFPSLGFPTLHVPSLNLPINLSEVEKKDTLSDKIKEKMRLDAIAEYDRVNMVETNPWKMTEEQLAEEGWVRLNLKSARDICARGFKKVDDPDISEF
jgi:hypothetical protein